MWQMIIIGQVGDDLLKSSLEFQKSQAFWAGEGIICDYVDTRAPISHL